MQPAHEDKTHDPMTWINIATLLVTICAFENLSSNQILFYIFQLSKHVISSVKGKNNDGKGFRKECIYITIKIYSDNSCFGENECKRSIQNHTRKDKSIWYHFLFWCLGVFILSCQIKRNIFFPLNSLFWGKEQNYLTTIFSKKHCAIISHAICPRTYPL